LFDTTNSFNRRRHTMFRRALSIGGLVILAGALLILTPGYGEAAGPGGGHSGGGGHFGGGGFHGGGHFGGYNSGFSHGGYNHGGYYGHPNAFYGYHNNYRSYGGYYGYGGYYSYPYYGGYNSYLYNGSYNSYPFYSYSGPYNPYSVTEDTGYNGSSAEATSSYSSGNASVTPPASSYQSYYPPTTATSDTAPVQSDNIARVTVRVPEDAEIWFEGSKTTSTGAVREYRSPSLTPGNRYTYEVRARWTENGREVTQTQNVAVTAGARVTVNFPAPRQTASQTATAK
jgi:uncharacterized protein (TIGR03000 family)